MVVTHIRPLHSIAPPAGVRVCCKVDESVVKLTLKMLSQNGVLMKKTSPSCDLIIANRARSMLIPSA